jgi:thiazolylpeptide-type bacteriocin precursor
LIGNFMTNAITQDVPAVTVVDALADIAQENFEVEDINDLNMFAPMSISLCSSSSTSSCSSCCS